MFIMAIFQAFFILSLVLTPITGECPKIEDIPVKWYDDWVCAVWWPLKGNPYAPDACNGMYQCILYLVYT